MKTTNTNVITGKDLINTADIMIRAAKQHRTKIVYISGYAAQWMFLGVINHERTDDYKNNVRLAVCADAITERGNISRIHRLCRVKDFSDSVRTLMYDDMRNIIDDLM